MTDSRIVQHDIEELLANHRLHDIPPHGSQYAFGKIHQHRASLKGYRVEGIKAVKNLALATQRPSGPQRKFLILARPRSGSTLLVDLLCQIEGLRCDREVLHFAVWRPEKFLNNLASTSPTATYGAKLLSYQMFEVQKLRNPFGFFRNLQDTGWSFIHLRRSTFAQSLSLSKSQATGIYEKLKAESRGVSAPDIEIDVYGFRSQLEWNAAMLDYEDLLMSAFPCFTVNYETDLKTSAQQQDTIDRICLWLGIKTNEVSARLKPTSGAGAGKVLNIQALRKVADDLSIG